MADDRNVALDTLASQIDLGPTLLSLIGFEGDHPMIGRDLTNPANTDGPGRAIMQFNTTQAYMEGDQVLVMQRDHPVEQFRYVDNRLVAVQGIDEVLREKALAQSIWSSLAYEKSLYRLGAKDFRVAGL